MSPGDFTDRTLDAVRGPAIAALTSVWVVVFALCLAVCAVLYLLFSIMLDSMALSYSLYSRVLKAIGPRKAPGDSPGAAREGGYSDLTFQNLTRGNPVEL